MVKIIQIRGGQKKDIMKNGPTIIGSVIAEIIDRGVKREDLAAMLAVRPPTISGYRHGAGNLDDRKIGKLAEIHGGYTERELIGLKLIEWIEQSKDFSIGELVEISKKKPSTMEAVNVA